MLGIVKSHTDNLCFIIAGEDFKSAPGLGSGPLLEVITSVSGQLRLLCKGELDLPLNQLYSICYP